MKTAVVFLQNKDDLFAYFPDEIADIRGNKMSYSHLGQHSACNPEYARESEPAKDYQDLKNELERIGYDLKVLNISKTIKDVAKALDVSYAKAYRAKCRIEDTLYPFVPKAIIWGSRGHKFYNLRTFKKFL